jgi:V/A-type H+-transporting ATPase subunit E
VERAEKDAAAILKAARDEAEKKRSSVLERAQKDAANRKLRMISYAELEARKAKLQAKQEMVDEVFEKAVERLVSLPDSQYLKVLSDMIVRSINEGSAEVVLSEKDRKRLGGEFINSINKRLSAEGKKADIKLSSETRGIRGGFILKAGDIEINNSFEAIIRMQRDQLETEVVKTLFGEGV